MAPVPKGRTLERGGGADEGGFVTAGELKADGKAVLVEATG
jgi:hypothetical protein